LAGEGGWRVLGVWVASSRRTWVRAWRKSISGGIREV
jgi:hypothetical protein